MILSDRDILSKLEIGDIVIEGFKRENLGPNSYDVTLYPELGMYKASESAVELAVNRMAISRDGNIEPILSLFSKNPNSSIVLDFRKKPETVKYEIPEEGFLLFPNQLYLARTNERFENPVYRPKLEGRSSCGRMGLDIHISAGYGDVGWNGYWVLELRVVYPLYIYPNMKIAQVEFAQVSSSPLKNYKEKGGKYAEQNGIVSFIPDKE